jgi:hypothetical protein
MRRAWSFLLLLIVACASNQSTRPASIAQPDMDAQLVHPVFFGSGDTAAATVEVRVLNRATVPITVNRVEIDSPGMGQYSLIRNIREFKETVQPGEVKALTMFATAIAETTRNPTEPLRIRTIIEFQAGTDYWREVRMTT